MLLDRENLFWENNGFLIAIKSILGHEGREEEDSLKKIKTHKIVI